MSNRSRQLSGRLLVGGLAVFLLLALISGCSKLQPLIPGTSAPATPLPGTAGVNTPQLPLSTEANTPASGGEIAATPAAPYAVSVRLSEGQSQPQVAAALPLATGEPLSPDDIASIVARLPALPTAPEDQTAFKSPQELIPPPLAGQTVQSVFPPAPPVVTPPSVGAASALKVLRYAPEGDIPVAPFVSVTFDQPMVPVGTLGDLAAEAVPVKIDPALPGTWRWLGTKTLTFEYDSTLIDRLPKATEFRVTVPAGTASAIGGKLAQEVQWSFRTPPPKVVTTYPDNTPQPLEPVFFVAFDQRIDPAAVLQTIRVSAAGQPVSVGLADDADIQKDSVLNNIVKSATAGRWLAFKASAPLPAGSDITVTIGPGTPSAEGPLVTTDAQTYAFTTYSPLRVEDHGCSYTDNNECRPLTPFYIRFNNDLDSELFAESMVRVSPDIPGLSVSASGDSIDIRGETKGQTTYQVTIDGHLQDAFGQQLGADAVLTFKVGAAQSTIIGPGQNFVTVDPSAQKPVFSVYDINYSQLAVQIYAVQPTDWPAFQKYLQDWQQTNTPSQIPGRKVFDQTMRVEAPADTLTQVDVDLSKYMDGGFGHFVVVVAPPKPLLFENDQQKYQRFAQTIQTWVQVTQIGLDAFNDGTDMVAWASALKDGAPLAGVTVTPDTGRAGVVTGADGTVKFAIPSGATYLTAKQGADQALLPRSNYAWGNQAWTASSAPDFLRWYVFDDRQMYRPGEDVHVKGWLRRIGNGPGGDVGLVGDAVTSVNYQITSSQGNDLGSGQLKVNGLGGFDLAFTLPSDVNLGPAQINLTAAGSPGQLQDLEFSHSFQIQEFRRPEFEVNARNETTGPYFAGDHAVVAVGANYYAGGPLPNADVTWNVTYSPGSYSPPNWPDFTFGTWQPWWEMPMVASSPFLPPIGKTGPTETFTGTTDASGTHYLRLDFNASNLQGSDPRPYSVSAEVTVMDVNRQAWTSSTSLLVHPASLYVGLRSDRYFVEHGTPLNVDFIVTDLDGNAVADRPVVVTAARMDWKFRSGSWQEVAVDVQTCNSGSTLKPGTCTFQTPVGGTYQITAMVTDSSGRPNQSQFTRWVSGGQLPPARQVTQEQVTLIPDKQTYQPGDVANILVQSPFSPAEGLLTVGRGGMLYTQRFHLDNGTTTLQVPIKDQYVPNLNIQVDLVGAAARTDDQGVRLTNVPPRPAYATGQLNLSIPPLQRTLSLQVTPGQRELEPGGQTTVTVVVKDAAGAPLPNAEVAVVVVDEAILALTNFQLPDPVATFYSDYPSELDAVYSRASIVLLNPQALADLAQQSIGLRAAVPMAAAAAPTAAPAATAAAGMEAKGGGGANGAQPAIPVRSNFNPLAVFAPSVTTDAGGQAVVHVNLPDNLTRYRVMAVAVEGDRRFGDGEANITARLPLMVRPSAPRFLNFGDKFELPVVLQNQTDAPLDVSVAVRADNLELTGPVSNTAGLRVTVPARDRIEVRFPAATHLAGTARLQIAAVSGTYADAATVELPVYTPATTEAFATYGVIDQGTLVQPVQVPTGVFPEYGGLEVNTSSTALQALTDAMLYLVSYPFEGTEQLSSRILAVAALRDVLTAFQAKGLPAPTDMEATVQSDITRLQGLQNDDGGFPYWRRGFDSIPFNTIHAAHALYRAQSKGFVVPADMLQRSLAYLRDIESHYPAWYSQHTRQTLSAYALYVRNLMGDRDPDKALQLINSAGLDHLSLEAIGWLWPVLEDAPQAATARDNIRVYVNNHVVETAGAANFTTDYDDQTYLLLSSDRRTDAILLDALITDSPQSDLIPKVVNGLLAHRTDGRWYNTQENVFVLLALDHYFQAFEAQTPDFVARLWLGSTYAGSETFQGRSTQRLETNIPMTYLMNGAQSGSSQNFILDKAGTGRLYYRLGLSYAPTNLNLDALDMGFAVQRRYEAVDNPADVSLDKDGIWHIRAGARVRVRVTMVADNRRYHVALVDPLPAGLEIVNPELAISGSTPQDPTSPNYRYGWWWWSTWYEQENLRDDRAEAFTSLLWDGVYEYTYIARATTPGIFVVPPAKAEEMYSPEVFGRSHSDLVAVEIR